MYFFLFAHVLPDISSPYIPNAGLVRTAVGDQLTRTDVRRFSFSVTTVEKPRPIVS